MLDSLCSDEGVGHEWVITDTDIDYDVLSNFYHIFDSFAYMITIYIVKKRGFEL